MPLPHNLVMGLKLAAMLPPDDPYADPPEGSRLNLEKFIDDFTHELVLRSSNPARHRPASAARAWSRCGDRG